MFARELPRPLETTSSTLTARATLSLTLPCPALAFLEKETLRGNWGGGLGPVLRYFVDWRAIGFAERRAEELFENTVCFGEEDMATGVGGQLFYPQSGRGSRREECWF